ncbi:MAG: hypothetical protein NTZ46_00760 [Verrucomicrobia bacterium]|nr:hypothetical protein [Verrucomicrobiota bacterium]
MEVLSLQLRANFLGICDIGLIAIPHGSSRKFPPERLGHFTFLSVNVRRAQKIQEGGAFSISLPSKKPIPKFSPMKRFISPWILGVITLVLAFSPAFAGAPKATPTPPPRHTVIGSISSESITVDTGLKTKTYAITKLTKFYFKGAPVSLNELQAGMRVNVVPGFDGKTASIITALDAPPANPAASPAAKPAAPKPTPAKR